MKEYSVTVDVLCSRRLASVVKVLQLYNVLKTNKQTNENKNKNEPKHA